MNPPTRITLQRLGSFVLSVIAVMWGCAGSLRGEVPFAEGGHLPGCGPMSAYSLLNSLDHDVSINMIEERFQKVTSRGEGSTTTGSLVSILEIREVLNDFGVPTYAFQLPRWTLPYLPCPCILYFQPGHWRGTPQEPGHFVTLLGTEGGKLRLLNWTDGVTDPVTNLPIRDVQVHWNGEVIVIRNRWWYLIPAGMVMIVLFWLRRWRAKTLRAKTLTAATTVICLLSVIQGCSSSVTPKPPEVPKLIFSEPIARLGRIPRTRVQNHEFEFTVWEKSPVKITKITTSCGCTKAVTDLIGQELAPGSRHSFSVGVNPANDGERRIRTVYVETDPPSTGLSVAMEYVVASGPTVGAESVRVRLKPGEVPEATLTCTNRRETTDPPLTLDTDASHGTVMEILSAEHSSEEIVTNEYNGEKVGIDTYTIKLRGKTGYGYGDLVKGKLTLNWSDGSVRDLDTVCEVPLPLEFPLDRVFCGLLKPGQAWSQSIPFHRNQLETFEIAAIEPSELVSAASKNTAIPTEPSRTSRISFTTVLKENSLDLSGQAPEAPGNFTGTLTLRFTPPTIPPLVLKVSGVVRPSASTEFGPK